MTQPFGGYKQSGNARDKCFDSFKSYTQIEVGLVPAARKAERGGASSSATSAAGAVALLTLNRPGQAERHQRAR